jgi:hypothetical protein
MPDNLWPDFDAAPTIRSPKTIIEEAGSGVNAKTKGLVRFYSLRTTVIEMTVETVFSLYAPALSFHFPFLSAKFAIEKPYPVTLIADKVPPIVANDEKELTTSLATIFNAPTTVATVQSLMLVSRDDSRQTDEVR